MAEKLMSTELKQAIQEFGETFEEFKTANDARLKTIEEKGVESSEDLAKIELIETKMGELDGLRERLEKAEVKLDTPGFSKEDGDKKELEHSKAFDGWIRSVNMEGGYDGAKEAELIERAKAVSIGTTTAGGHAVPEVINRQIDSKLLDMSVMLPLVNVVNVGTSDYKELVDVKGAAGGWVGETDTRSETGTPGLEQIAPTFGIVYAYPKATEESLQDIFFNVQQWLINSSVEQFDKLIGAAIISGDGSNKPTGFLDGTPVVGDDEDASPTRAFGTLQYVATGIAAAFQNDRQGSPLGHPVDTLIDTVYKLKAGYRGNARWLMNKSTLNTVRKWKDNDSQYIWQPSMQAGEPSQVLGYGVSEMEDMPNEGANTFPIAFGDFNAGYTFANRVGTSITIDDNINTPGYVKFYVRRRVGGILRNDDAIKVVKCAAS
ncbi:MAG: phage major capsid protein [Deltaproteobacteria bacterium]|nr:MAG: phage major capsid protein [Deltaproteobacteria bacterium]